MSLRYFVEVSYALFVNFSLYHFWLWLSQGNVERLRMWRWDVMTLCQARQHFWSRFLWFWMNLERIYHCYGCGFLQKRISFFSTWVEQKKRIIWCHESYSFHCFLPWDEIWLFFKIWYSLCRLELFSIKFVATQVFSSRTVVRSTSYFLHAFRLVQNLKLRADLPRNLYRHRIFQIEVIQV